MAETGINGLIDMEDEGEFIDAEVVLQQILDDPNLVQHVTRTGQEGHQTIAGYFRLQFTPGQQRQILHIPFTPPLKFIPRVSGHATDQHDVRVRVTDRQKFGLRVEIILPRQTDSNHLILVEIIASESD